MQDFSQYIKALPKYLSVTLYMARSRIRNQTSGSLGGFLWWIAEPMFYCGIYYFLFTVVFPSRTENFLAFLITGLMLWRWISLTLNSTTNAVIGGGGLMKQMDIPKIIFPVQNVLIESQKFLLSFSAIYALIVFAGIADLKTLYLFPLVFMVAVLLLTGAGLILSVIAPFFPDIRNFVRLFLRGLLFLSGVFYQADRIPEKFRTLFFLNPLAVLLEDFRAVLLFGNQPDFAKLGLVLGLACMLLFVGLYLHWRLNRVLPRYLS